MSQETQSSTAWTAWREPARTNFHGILMSVVVAVAAMSLAEHYHVSAMLFALLLGMAMNFLSTEGRCVPGIQFSASTLLRIGVALLGVRITLGADHGARRVADRDGRAVGGADDRLRHRAGAPAGLSQPVRRADGRRRGDLRRFGGDGDRRGDARSCRRQRQGARHHLHGHRRQHAVDGRDGALPDDRHGARPGPASRPASSWAARSTTWRRWSAPATACRRRPATSRRSSSCCASRCCCR